MRGVRVAVDIGGTFTDLVAQDAETGQVVRAKADSTPSALEQGVLAAVASSGITAGEVSGFIHGTTVVINTLTERTGARTGLVTTRGFRDVLEIARGNRPDLYNLAYRKPVPFVPRHLRFEVTERMTYRGEPVERLDTSALEDVARQLADAGVRAVAVCFLHAWANPDHERQAAEILAAHLPGTSVVASHQVSGQWREYERTSTTVMSAYAQPVVAGYLTSLRDALRGAGVGAPLYAMRSNGGVCSFDRAAATPITLLESGPVAGVTAAAELGRQIGSRHVLTLDVGGTTAKTAAVRDGEVRIETLHHIGRDPAHAGHPVQVPTVQIMEIGAGGGSIAWTDPAGGLHVGPRSAGADPGPACYGRGGRDPTLTDANLVAGRLNPDYFLGGAMKLDAAAAERELARLGERLAVDASAAARGVLRYAVAQMSHALRLVTLRRGYDPRDFTFIAYGGAGPLHASLLARELGITRTVIPAGPGHFSAFGMLAGPLRGEAVRTVVGPLASIDLPLVFAAAEELALTELGQHSGGASMARYAELRYRGQEHALEVPVPDSALPARGPGGHATGEPPELREAFDRRCMETYSFRLDTPLEIVSVRVTATAAAGARMRWGEDPGSGNRTATRRKHQKDSRLVDLDPYGPRTPVPILSRAEVAETNRINGPCIVEETAATTLVLPGQVVSADEFGNLVVEEHDW